jgi:hypothetical protein
MMLILLYITLVWLKIVAGDALIFFWLWLARDRGVNGLVAAANYAGVAVFWLTPWVALLRHESSLYAGQCGLGQGLHDCGPVEFLWSALDWVRLGLLLDVSLFAAIVILMTHARVARSSGLALAQPTGSAPPSSGRA